MASHTYLCIMKPRCAHAKIASNTAYLFISYLTVIPDLAAMSLSESNDTLLKRLLKRSSRTGQEEARSEVVERRYKQSFQNIFRGSLGGHWSELIRRTGIVCLVYVISGLNIAKQVCDIRTRYILLHKSTSTAHINITIKNSHKQSIC